MDFKQNEKFITSAAIKQKVFMPVNNPTQKAITIITPEMVRMADKRPTRRKWDQPGDVGENVS